jgi:hypothetical protein
MGTYVYFVCSIGQAGDEKRHKGKPFGICANKITPLLRWGSRQALLIPHFSSEQMPMEQKLETPGIC